MENIGPYVTLLGFLLQLAVILGGGIWRISQLEAGLHAAIQESRKEIDDRLDATRREFGETSLALRQKIYEVEIWSRDNFMRRDGFYKVRDELSAELKSIRDEIKKELRRLEEKYDAGIRVNKKE